MNKKMLGRRLVDLMLDKEIWVIVEKSQPPLPTRKLNHTVSACTCTRTSAGTVLAEDSIGGNWTPRKDNESSHHESEPQSPEYTFNFMDVKMETETNWMNPLSPTRVKDEHLAYFLGSSPPQFEAFHQDDPPEYPPSSPPLKTPFYLNRRFRIQSPTRVCRSRTKREGTPCPSPLTQQRRPRTPELDDDICGIIAVRSAKRRRLDFQAPKPKEGLANLKEEPLVLKEESTMPKIEAAMPRMKLVAPKSEPPRVKKEFKVPKREPPMRETKPAAPKLDRVPEKATRFTRSGRVAAANLSLHDMFAAQFGDIGD
ncbi:hypothetical protein K402DRAFT_419405 [Aulographum hederae CBS 113979]|uniref:Uncharacterized protein n=1 Tax=Aulographum hederae CBS 113979 TaxID=1176131 RepID=A0A6G1H685_9PEZI|nr:hypothetical protein K402DRAFT_419405 [Aulographum hederae CBS 113979]